MSFVGFRGIERVELSNKWLVFCPGPSPREFEPPALLRFLSLAEADGVEVLDFAQRHGPLGLCIHSLPLYHPNEAEAPYPPARAGSRRCERLFIETEAGFAEPWRRWCDHARWARALVKLANALRAKRVPDNPEIWRAALQPPPPPGLVRFGTLMADADYAMLGRNQDTSSRKKLATAVDLLLHSGSTLFPLHTESGQIWPKAQHRDTSTHPAFLQAAWLAVARMAQFYPERGGVRHSLAYDGRLGGPKSERHSPTLFGALGLQLEAEIVSNEIFFCSCCGDPYKPQRRPRSGQHNYCERSECARAANRDRARRHRRKNLDAS
jgi:hypothetical protein